MKIKKIEIFSTHEPYRRPIPIAVGIHDSRDNILVKITSDNGLFGFGEGSPLIPSYSGEVRNQMVDDIVKRIAPDILGQNINNVEDIMNLINKIYHNKYYYMCTIAAVDIALFDLLGKFKKRPVFKLIRNYLKLNRFKKIPELPANFTVSRNATKTDDKINDMIKEAEEYIDQGYSVIKVKVGIFKKSDIKSMERLYSHIKKKYPGFTVTLFPDGNQAYRSINEALQFLKKVELKIAAFEQPFHRNKPHLSSKLYKKLKERKKAPLLITDEGSASIEEMENVLLSDAAGGALLKMVRSGGFSYLIWLQQLLKKYPKFKLAPCSMTETGVGTAANLHGALVVYEHCHPKLGFGFDGPMQVIGDNYKKGRDAILYKNKKTGWIIKNKMGVAIYDPKQIIGNGKGLGIDLNQKYINKIMDNKTIIYLNNGNVVKGEMNFKKNKEMKEIIGKQKYILKHPRY